MKITLNKTEYDQLHKLVNKLTKDNTTDVIYNTDGVSCIISTHDETVKSLSKENKSLRDELDRLHSIENTIILFKSLPWYRRILMINTILDL